MRRYLALSLLALIATALLASFAGCGDDDDSSSAADGGVSNGAVTDGTESTDGGDTSEDATESVPSEPTVKTQAEYIKKADAICREDGKQILAEVQKNVPSGGIDRATASDFETLVEEVLVPGLEAELAKLRALGPAPSNPEEMEAILGLLQAQIDRAREDPVAFASEGNPFTASQLRAQKYGFEVCGALTKRPPAPGA